jgi:hypothetical protein
MIAKKKTFALGAGLVAVFAAVLLIIFLPVFGGQNGLDYLDSLYNSISKGSAYKNITDLQAKVPLFEGTQVNLTLGMRSERAARQAALQFQQGGAMVQVDGTSLKVSGDLGRILGNCLADADLMYANNGTAVNDKYGFDARQALYNWWVACKEMDRDLTRQKTFKNAKIAADVNARAVELAYNYYGIAPENIGDRIGVVFFSLIFYVIYTLWYGFGLMYMFEGWGMHLGH